MIAPNGLGNKRLDTFLQHINIKRTKVELNIYVKIFDNNNLIILDCILI
jgi:hypothetical protein